MISYSLVIYCCCSVMKSCPTFCDLMDCSMPGFPVLHYLLEFAQIHIHWSMIIFNHYIICQPLLLLPSIFPSTRVFSWCSVHQVAKAPELQHQSFQRIFRVDSFRTDWFVLAVYGILKHLLICHNLKASILLCSAFFLVHLPHLSMTTGKP